MFRRREREETSPTHRASNPLQVLAFETPAMGEDPVTPHKSLSYHRSLNAHERAVTNETQKQHSRSRENRRKSDNWRASSKPSEAPQFVNVSSRAAAQILVMLEAFSRIIRAPRSSALQS